MKTERPYTKSLVLSRALQYVGGYFSEKKSLLLALKPGRDFAPMEGVLRHMVGYGIKGIVPPFHNHIRTPVREWNSTWN